MGKGAGQARGLSTSTGQRRAHQLKTSAVKNGGHGAALCIGRARRVVHAHSPSKTGVNALVAHASAHQSCSIVKQPTLGGPSFGRAWGLPVSFPYPPK